MSFRIRGMQIWKGSAVVLPASAMYLSSNFKAQTHQVHTAEIRRASWEVLLAYAADQKGEVAAGRGPIRAPEIDERYRRYFAWSKERGLSAVDYLALTLRWRCVAGGPWIALEPNIVPYHMDSGIEHWNLWYHPSTTPGTMDLDMQPGSVVEFVGTCKRGHVEAVRGWAADPTCKIAVVLDDTGERIIVDRSELRPIGWVAVLKHVRLLLPDVLEEELVLFQNIPEMRSVPQIAHAHVFVRPTTDATRTALRRLKREWRMTSPWAEHERLGGRGSEVGFGEE